MDERTLVERLLDAATAHHDPRIVALLREAAMALIRIPAPENAPQEER